MRILGGHSFGQAWKGRKPVVVTAAIVLLALVAGGGAILSGALAAGSQATPSPSEVAVGTPLPSYTLAPTETPTEEPTATPVPTPMLVAATTDGVWLPADQAALATRHPIAVMIDDQIRARPQSGLSQADIVYQAPAEGGVPRYMAIFQTQDPPEIGPIRSSRLYFVAWAEEWRAMYAHVGGAHNAIQYIYTVDKKYMWNADEFHWAPRYMWRVGWRRPPHNVYTTGVQLQALAKRLGATAPFTTSPWTFGDEFAPDARPFGGTITVPYYANNITYKYDRTTNTYPRSVTGEGAQFDHGNGHRIAPSNVVVLYEPIGALLGSNNEKKGRLDISFNGKGRAEVFNNGMVIDAVWSKKNDWSPTLLTYARGSLKGQPVALVRGQIFVQIVETSMNVTWTTGLLPPPQH